MLDVLQPNSGQLLTFLLILTRISGVFFLAPVLGSRNIPAQVKIGLSVITALAVLPFVPDPNISASIHIIDYTLLIAKELSVGAIIGFTATMVFMGFLVAGQIIDMQMGFGIVNVFDPISDIAVSVMGQFKNLLAILVFLAINGHHFLLTAITRSFDVVPLTKFALTTTVTNSFVDMVVNMFIIGLKIGGPAIGILLITDLAMGIIARTVPQMNVFIVGMPVKVTIGFITLIAMLSFFFMYMGHIFAQMPEQLMGAIR